jgi:16S rRNA (cytidine1402-2'-O)-methyltransferase
VAGRLYVVATPIGNLEDLSPRARQTLASVQLIAAEDTRHTAQLLRAIGLPATGPSTTLVSLHDYNEQQRLDQLIQRLQAGAQVALVSDAGTPLLSDPGFALVRAAAAAGIEIHAVAGPSALTAALSVAGLPLDRFAFEGFLPTRQSERRGALARLAHETRTLVFFEAPHRIVATLKDLAQIFGEQRLAVVTRELTKLHESVYRGTLAQLCLQAESDEDLARGEITLLVGGAPKETAVNDGELLARALQLLLQELPPARAAAIASQLAGCTRHEAYELALRMRPK